MKLARHTFAICSGLACVTLAAAGLFSMAGPSHDRSSKKKDNIAAALDTLEQQLQRRFHDRNNVTFGFERVVRAGARRHNSTVMDLRRMGGELLGDDGKPVARRESQGSPEFEIAPGKWVGIRDLKETMHAENKDEEELVSTLRNVDVAIYTAGLFSSKGEGPNRLKGPAYLRLNASDAPGRDAQVDLASRAWRTNNDADEYRKNGWTFRVVKVKADDKSCIQCHSQQFANSGVAPEQKSSLPSNVGDPIGVFVIASRLK